MPFHHEGLDNITTTMDFGGKTMMDLMNSESNTTEEMLKTGEKTLLEAEVVKPGETVVMMAGRLSGLGLSSSVIICTIGENVPKK
jgi:pyruvate kinase